MSLGCRVNMVLAGFCAVASGGCFSASSPSPPSSSFASLPGFIQTIETTKCRLGSDVRIVNDPGDKQWLGTSGVFDVDLANQSSFCLTDLRRPVKGPSVPAEIADVKAYFVGAGMHSSQIGPIGTTFTTDSSGAEIVNTVISGVFAGVPVVESEAWASLEDGQSLGEGVYWPVLPSSVSDELSELKVIVANPNRLAALQAKLPANFVTGSIVIHHSNIAERVPGHPAEEVTLQAHACYNAIIAEGGVGVTECHLPDASKFTFPASLSPVGSERMTKSVP